MGMTTFGVVFRPQLPPERLRAVAEAADEAGLDELWLWEDCFYESGLAPAAAALGWTERVRVGVGLLPVPLRNVALSAMEVATLDRLFPGRATVAFGHGVQKWMGQAGVRPESPLTLLREYLTALKRLLAGEEVTTGGRYVTLDRVKLRWPPDPAPAVYAGAIGPRSLALCAEVADGIVLTSFAGVDGVRETREMAGELPITAYLRAAVGPGARRRLDEEDTTAPGFANDEIPAAIERFTAAGATAIILEPTPDEPDLEGLVRYAAGLAESARTERN
jgi:alkanesulfonate monooxygenase SsuD/methylene tetrahydromethanopterin reductase-like flavin-dependent oxidoreductase (luciferase family)